MGRCFEQKDVFPDIAESIRGLQKADFATHDEIVPALLAHPLGAPLVDAAYVKCPTMLRRNLASNMVQWFSQRFARTEYYLQFERKRLRESGIALFERDNDPWAYKPLAIASAVTTLDLADIEEFDSLAVPEGRLRLVQHLRHERNGALVHKKKLAVLKATGALKCAACQFDFSERYGARGTGFCEVHHIVPLSRLTSPVQTRLADLVVLCSNCHRMIHRAQPWITLEELRGIINPARK